jgi:hypothetical protein
VRQKRDGVAPAVIAIVAVALIAVAAIGAYETLLAPGSKASSTLTSLNPTATSSASSSTTTTPTGSSSSSTASLSTSCASTAGSVGATEGNIVPLLSAFSALELQYNYSSSTLSSNYTESYATAYVSSTTYKINLVSAGEGQNVTSTAWILKNGTAIAIDEFDENVTGPESQELVEGSFAGFSAEVEVSSQLSTYTASQDFHSTGSSSTTIGSNTLTVTSYAANTLPITITPCAGGVSVSTSLTSFQMSVGEPTGTGYDLVTNMQLTESSTTGGATTTVSSLIQVISFTTR